MPDMSAEHWVHTVRVKNIWLLFQYYLVVHMLACCNNSIRTFSLISWCLLPPLFLWREMFCYKRLEYSPKREKRKRRNREKKINSDTRQWWQHSWFGLIIAVRCWQADEQVVCYLIHSDIQSAIRRSNKFKALSTCACPFLFFLNENSIKLKLNTC